ncbi:MAG: carboxy-S-adenosyl-L-methionine synthase CmoA [Gammaproteobacteria bacterium]|nr:carboxy-S-adenosyl-L-methionine synthase CmoA [Gammaproteobacteria bacterium]
MANNDDDAHRSKHDRVYRHARSHLVDFAFDEKVADVFPDMIRRSVPGYDTVVALTGLIAAEHLQRGTRCYDLGCSLGAVTHAILRQIGATVCEIHAVDNSRAMLSKAQVTLAPDGRVRWQLADIRDVSITNASVVVMNYTLQFIAPDERLAQLKHIHAGLNEGGVLIVSEKVISDGYEDGLHLAFKKANGYSELEISQKRTALENVMQPDTLDEHLVRFRHAGFADTRVWFRCLNWVSFLAFK